MKFKALISSSSFSLLVIGALLLSLSPIFVRLSEVGPIATGLYRMSLALPAFWIWMIIQNRSETRIQRDWNPRSIALLSLAGILFGLDLTAWNWSLSLTSVANATVLGNAAPVFVTVAAWILFREKPTRLFITGLMLTLIGVAITMSGSFAISPTSVLGDALGLLTAVFYGGYLLTVSRLRKSFRTSEIMAISGATAALFLLILTLATENHLAPLTLLGWIWLLALAYVSQVAGQSLVASTMAHLSAALSATILLIQPAGAAVLAWLLFDETFTYIQTIGILVILAGIWLAKRGS